MVSTDSHYAFSVYYQVVIDSTYTTLTHFIQFKGNSGQNPAKIFLRMTVKTKLKLDDWFKSYGPMKYPLGSPLVAAILRILPSMHLMSKSTCGSCLEVCDSQQFLYHIWHFTLPCVLLCEGIMKNTTCLTQNLPDTNGVTQRKANFSLCDYHYVVPVDYCMGNMKMGLCTTVKDRVVHATILLNSTAVLDTCCTCTARLLSFSI